MALFGLFGKKEVETRTFSTELTHKYATGELRSKEITEKVIVNNTDTTVTLYTEFYNKAGSIILKYKKTEKENSPLVWESETLSSIKSFADDEEKQFVNKIYKQVQLLDPEYAKKINFDIPWYYFDSGAGYTAIFPEPPTVTVKNTNEHLTVHEALYENEDENYNISIISHKLVNSDESFSEFFNQLLQFGDQAKKIEEKVVKVLDIESAYLKVQIKNADDNYCLHILRIPYQYQVVSISVNRLNEFISDEIFYKFYSNFKITL